MMSMAFMKRKTARVGEPLDPERNYTPEAPGAVNSPQMPGEVPDRSSVPGEDVLPVPPPVGEVRRPRAEYGSAQRIMGVFAPTEGREDDPARFEQATASYEELRKANPSLRTPVRPTPGYALSDGVRLANPELTALSEQARQPDRDE
jgi:hypothetical protein